MSLFTTATGADGFTPDDYAPVVVNAVEAASLAFSVASVFETSSTTTHVPIVNADAGADWVSEGAEIGQSDATLGEIAVSPAKVAGVSRVSREMADDSDPASVEIVGQGLARSIARKVDAAFVGAVASPAPSGLGSLTGAGAVDAGTGFTDLDPFLQAVINAEQAGGQVTSFVASPADAQILLGLKTDADSNVPLLGQDATVPTRRTIAGVPLFISPDLAAGTVWGLDRSRCILVRRADTQVTVSDDAFFTSDEVALKATMRIGFAFPSPAVLQKITYTVA